MTNLITVVIAAPGEDARIIEVDPAADTDWLQKAIGGWLEACPFQEHHRGERLAAWCHEEALLDGLPWNRWVGPGSPVAGPIVVTGIDEQGETIGLSESAALACAIHLNHVPRLAPEPSSIDAYEALVGHPAVRVFFGDGKVQQANDGNPDNEIGGEEKP